MVKARFLLDSNVLSEPLRPRPNQYLLNKLEAHQYELVTASIVWHELWFGLERLPESRKRRKIEDYLINHIAPSIVILPYDQKAATIHGSNRARLQAKGLTPPFRDGQIASIALSNDLSVVTANTKDFMHFEGLEVVNWMQ